MLVGSTILKEIIVNGVRDNFSSIIAVAVYSICGSLIEKTLN